jgi:hypothetical protein
MQLILWPRCLAVAVFFWAGILPVAAGEFEDGKAAYLRGDYSIAQQTFLRLAVQGGAQSSGISW